MFKNFLVSFALLAALGTFGNGTDDAGGVDAGKFGQSVAMASFGEK